MNSRVDLLEASGEATVERDAQEHVCPDNELDNRHCFTCVSMPSMPSMYRCDISREYVCRLGQAAGFYFILFFATIPPSPI